MVFRSPFPDVSLPDVALTDFVLGNVAARADRPALVDGTTGRTLTFGELVEQDSAPGGGPVAPRHPQGRCRGHLGAQPARVRRGVPRGRSARRHPDHREPGLHRRGDGVPARTTRRAVLLVTTAALARPGARGSGAGGRHPIEIITHRRRRRTCRSLASIAPSTPTRRRWPSTRRTTSWCMPYSSGTTGLPKGVMLTHRNLVANLAQIDAIETPDLPRACSACCRSSTSTAWSSS